MIPNWIVAGFPLILFFVFHDCNFYFLLYFQIFEIWHIFKVFAVFSPDFPFFCHASVGKMGNFHISRPVSVVVPYRVCVRVEYPCFHSSKLATASFRICCFSLSLNPSWFSWTTIVGYWKAKLKCSGVQIPDV
jgi:hypothetical protein